MTRLHKTVASNQIHWEITSVAVELALLRLQLVIKLFNPLQPRVPAGTPEGGQWANDESLIKPIAGRERDRLSGQELSKDPYLNRHIVDGHVGKTDQELIERLASMQERALFGLLRSPYTRRRVGTFDSIESARDFISSTIDKNSAEIERVANGDEEEAFIQARFGRPTGREAVSIPRDSPIRVCTTYGVAMFIVHDSTSDSGFRIITAYPENAGED